MEEMVVVLERLDHGQREAIREQEIVPLVQGFDRSSIYEGSKTSTSGVNGR